MMLSAIADHLWQTTVFVITIWIVTLALRHHAARVRFALWSIASAKFLIPFSLLIGVGSLLPHRSLPFKPSMRVIAIETFGSPFEQPAEMVAEAPVTPKVAEPSRQDIDLTSLFMMVWLAGFVVFAGHRAFWLFRTNQILRHTAAVEDEESRKLWQTVAELCNERRVHFMVSRTVVEPGIYGVISPTLVLPAGITAKLSDSELRSVVVHELQHVERRDNLAAAAHMLVETLFWFHPLVWWIGSRLLAERELACDETVLAKGVEPNTYARAILQVCQYYVVPPAAHAARVTGSNLKTRIVAIMRNSQPRSLNRTQRFLLSAIAGFAVIGPVALGVLSGSPAHEASVASSPIQNASAAPILSRTPTSTIQMTKPPVKVASKGADMFSGTWILNITQTAKANEDSGYKGRGFTGLITENIEADDEAMKVIRRDAAGPSHEFIIKFDGKDYPYIVTVDGQPNNKAGFTYSATKIDAHTIEFTIKAPIGSDKEIMAISKDGKVLTLKEHVSGKPDSFMIWEKQLVPTSPVQEPRPTHLAAEVTTAARETMSTSQPQTTASPSPPFEVVSIKPSDPNAPIRGIVCHGTNSPNPNLPVGLGRCLFNGVTLKQIINIAYEMGNLLQSPALDQTITGGPSWVSTEKFDIQAKAEDPEHTTREQFLPMMQAMLTDRFTLKFHRGTIEVSGYTMMVAKDGSKLKVPDAKEPHRLGVSRGPEPGLQSLVGQMSGTGDLAKMLSNILFGQPVEDKTGITGPYDFTMTWAPGDGERNGSQPGSPSPGGPSLFTAIQEQLGLRLETQKVSIQTFVIDSAGKPTQD